VQLVGYAISGAREKGRVCLDFVDKLGAGVSEKDVVARGYARLWRAVFTFALESEMSLALSLAEQAAEDLAEGQVMYRLSLAHTVQAFAWWGLGDLDRSELAARRGRAIAQEIRDDYHEVLATWYLGLSLSEHADPAKLEEAEQCAQAMGKMGTNPVYAASHADALTARIAVSRGDWVRAEGDGRKARAGFVSHPPYQMIASAPFILGLVRLGRAEEAATVAREDLAVLARIGSPVWSEVLFRIAAAEALFAGGDRSEAESTLREALRQIELRRAKIFDPSLKESYLTRREENRRAAELARAWLEKS
jgi:hypothetical protein